MKKIDPVLCFIKNGVAYFTTQELKAQTGDDWDDTPYEINAGPPYSAEGNDAHWTISAYRYPRHFMTPAELAGSYSPYSVEDINAGAVAWLYSAQNGERIAIYAGTTLSEFKRIMAPTGGIMPAEREA